MIKKIIIYLMILCTGLFASVSATVDKSEVVRGDSVTLNLSASGDDVKFPSISDIGGYSVDSSSRSQSITIINGKTSKTITNSYTFTPLKSVTIPSYSIEVDGKIEKTKPIDIKVVSAAKAGINPDFSLRMIANKQEAYVGEPITLKIIFRQKRDVPVEAIQFANPTFPSFWAKSDGKDRKQVVGDYVIHNITYVLIPQQAGEFTISPVKVAIAKRVQVRDAFSFVLQRIRWKNLFSNELKIKVKPLPNNVSVFGKFSIKASVDKEITKANKPVNLTLTIRGEGNIDDIDSFDLKVPNATVYKNKPKRDTYLENGVYKGVFRQKFALVGDGDFVIPPIKFTYFDKDEQKVKTIKTKPIKIKVTGGGNFQATQTPHKLITSATAPKEKIVKKIVYKEANPFEKWIYLLIGLFVGFVLSNLKYLKRFGKKQSSEHPLSYEIRKAKSDKELLKILLPYVSKNQKIKEIVNQLEENIYMKKSHKIDKKALSKEIEELLNPKDEDDE